MENRLAKFLEKRVILNKVIMWWGGLDFIIFEYKTSSNYTMSPVLTKASTRREISLAHFSFRYGCSTLIVLAVRVHVLTGISQYLL